MKKGLFVVFFSLMMLAVAAGTFAQEVKITPWGYGLETSFGLTSGYGIPDSFSLSFQGMLDAGGGLSLDWISLNIEEEDSSGNKYVGPKAGLLGSLFLGFPIGDIFRPYVGGGLGIGFGKLFDDYFFAWKLDAGVVAWLSNNLYVKTGYTYDNIRKHSISVGIGLKLYKTVTDLYRNADGSTFRRTWNNILLWDNSGTPYRIYGDSFAFSEVVRTYQKTTTSSSYSPASYETRTSGGEILTTELQDQYGRTIGTATTRTPEKTETIKTRDAEITTRYYVYNVTVTRNWYTRTWYYKDRVPTTERVYQDVESAVLVNMFSDTERR